jgi:DNA-binding transcriptional MerR regulator/effector-binding domain-containing protein
MKGNLYTIGEISKICGIKQSKLRYYDEIGVIKPYHVDENTGYRYYSNETLRDIPVLHYYQTMGFSLKEIPALLEREDLSYLDSLFSNRIDETREHIKEECMIMDSIASWQDLITETKNVLQWEACPVTVKYFPQSEYYLVHPDIFPGMCYDNLLINTTICSSLLVEGTYTLGALFIAYPDGERNHWEDISLFIKNHPDAKHAMETSLVGGFSAVTCYHRGSFDSVGETVAKMKSWAKKHQFTLRGDLIERSVIDCWSIKNTDWWLMEIFLPIVEKDL